MGRNDASSRHGGHCAGGALTSPRGYSLWAAIVCCSVLWMFASRVTLSPNPWAAAGLLILGVIATCIGIRKAACEESVGAGYLLLLVPLAPACFWLPLPVSLGAWLLACGVVAGVIGGKGSRRWSGGILLVGLVLVIQAPLMHLADVIAVRNHSAPPLDTLTYWVLKALGMPVTFDGEMPYVRTMRFLFGLPASWERIAFPVLLNAAAGGLLAVGLLRPAGERLRAAGWFVVTLVGFFVLRYIVLVVAFVNAMYHVDYFSDEFALWLFWSPAVTLVSMLPLIWILGRVVPLDITSAGGLLSGVASEGPRSGRLAGAGLVALSCALFTAVVGYHGVGEPKQGRLMLDETHSGWEKSTREYDETWYGAESGYNYYCIAQYLQHYYDVDINTKHALTSDYLAGFDVLLLKNPTLPYSDEETEALVQFVRDGGGIFLMGEHTNVFGTSHPLNQLAGRFGFFFRYDCVFDLERKFEQFHETPELLRHPAVAELDEFLFATSCSIEPTDRRVNNVILGHGLYSLPIEYASGNFYPQVEPRSDMAFGTMSQLVARRFGRGRVIGFSDSTCFSNFSSHNPGKPELLLGATGWLNRMNGSFPVRLMFLLGALAAAAAGLRLLRPSSAPAGVWLATIILAVGAVAVGAKAITAHTTRNYPLPEVVRPFKSVVFDLEHSDFDFPITGFVKDQDRACKIFYQWILRLRAEEGDGEPAECYPFMRQSLDGTLDTAGTDGLAVIIRPRKTFSAEDIGRVRSFIEAGGTLLVMDGPSNKISASNTLLEPLGLSIRRQTKPAAGQVTDVRGEVLTTVSRYDWVEGGLPRLWAAPAKPIMATKEIGEGMVCVMSACERFSDPQMGFSQSNVPDESVLDVYALEFRLIRGLLTGNLDNYFSGKQEK